MTFFRHVHHRFFRIYAGGAGLFCLVLFVGLGLCLKNDNTADSADAQCLECHVGMWNAAIALPVQHLPFLDRHCTLCHLADTVGTSAPLAEAGAVALFTASAVNQEPQWAKRQVFVGTASLTGEQQFVLAGLQLDVRYRFRIVSEDAGAEPGQARTVTHWLGLLPQELLNSGQVNFEGLALSRGADGEVNIVWSGPVGVRGWVEVEELGSIGVASSAEVSQPTVVPSLPMADEVKQDGDWHPLMRDPAELAIELCYSCHPQSSLGTSHPVRIYAHGGDIIIPDELPTVENGMLTCVTCHNPHASAGKQLVREEVATKLCVACHVNFKGSSASTLF